MIDSRVEIIDTTVAVATDPTIANTERFASIDLSDSVNRFCSVALSAKVSRWTSIPS